MLNYRAFLWVTPFLAMYTLARIVPTEPTENQSFRTGETCPITWTSDGAVDGWKSMRIDLMSGVQPATSVAVNVAESVSGSEASSFSWTCPSVEFDGPVYSYMFTPLDGSDGPIYSPQFTASIDTLRDADAPGAPEPSQTNIADVADGAAHIADPGPDADDGEEMLENIDSDLGGADSSPTGDSNNANNFIVAGSSSTPEASPSTEIVGLREEIQLGPLETEITRTIQGHRQTTIPDPTPTTSSRFVTILSTSSNGSAFTEFGNSTRSSTDGSTRQSTGDVQGVIHLLLLAICMTWFM
ncbi:hypothetical protein CPB86DRAFT_810738 [Serendipita vermifera]|nr:hypothetical protein CPB86DRAFT_810738 [Serendipita vermifera]